MNLGMFMMPLHPPEKPRTQCFEEDIKQVVFADRLGFTEAWIGQHHSLAWEPIPANDLFIAHVLPLTKTIRLGTGVSIIPQHHPVNLSVRLAMLDHLSHGRLNCGFGQGGIPTDWELFDLPDGKTQGLMTIEGIDLILKLWQAAPPFDFRGRFWHVRLQSLDPGIGMGTLLKPYQQPHPPLAMSIIKGKSLAARLAGQRGYIPLSTSLVPVGTAAEHWQMYCAGAAEADRHTPDRSIWRVCRSIFVGDSSQDTWDHVLGGTFSRSVRYLLDLLKASSMLDVLKHDPDMADEEVTPEYLLRELCIIGDPSACIRQLQALWDATGGFGTLLMIAHDWDDKAKWMRSMELLAREVIPVLPTV